MRLSQSHGPLWRPWVGTSSLSAVGVVPASSLFVCAGPGSVATSSKGVSVFGWGIPDAAALMTDHEAPATEGRCHLASRRQSAMYVFVYRVLLMTLWTYSLSRIAYPCMKCTYVCVLFIVVNEES